MDRIDGKVRSREGRVAQRRLTLARRFSAGKRIARSAFLYAEGAVLTEFDATDCSLPQIAGLNKVES
jgi:hypothetical protein